MGDARLSRELRAFQGLAQVLAAGARGPEDVLARLRAEVRDAFGLERVDVLDPDAPASAYPLVRRAARDGCAVRDGKRVAAPLQLEQRCFGYLIGDAAGGELDLDETELQLLSALTCVAAVFVAKAREADALTRSLEARSSFVSVASHELRTPVAVVHGIVSTLHLRGDRLQPEQRRELRATAYEQTRRLALLTEQLLDLSRLEAGVGAARVERFEPRRLVDELVSRIDPERRDDVELRIDPELELETDPAGFERVVSNLIVNALRHGAPPVCVRLEVDPEPRVVVEDAGPGIQPELLPRLFERFTRGGGTGGSGLGLSIARSYAEAMGGSLDYEQADPHGARFVLALPRAAVAATPRA